MNDELRFLKLEVDVRDLAKRLASDDTLSYDEYYSLKERIDRKLEEMDCLNRDETNAIKVLLGLY